MDSLLALLRSGAVDQVAAQRLQEPFAGLLPPAPAEDVTSPTSGIDSRSR